MESKGENTERLINAGVIPASLPEPYNSVVEALSGEEVEALVSVKRRLDEANASIGGPGDVGYVGMVVPL
ncbi:MAG: aroma-sacti cluster domain-containing protein [Gaiellaceae bacterium]